MRVRYLMQKQNYLKPYLFLEKPILLKKAMDRAEESDVLVILRGNVIAGPSIRSQRINS